MWRVPHNLRPDNEKPYLPAPSMPRSLAVVCLAAGLGKRTKVSIPKVLLPLCGRTLAGSALDVTDALLPDRTIVLVHHQADKVQRALANRTSVTFVDQGKPMGTGHAVKAAMHALGDFDGDVLVIYGDCPLMTTATLSALRLARGTAPCAMLTAYPSDTDGLGRILRDEAGRLLGIREAKDCSKDQLLIDEINAGFYCFDARALGPALQTLKPNNAQGEYYLTDVIAQFVAEGRDVATIEAEAGDEILGVNSLADLAVARLVMQERILMEHLHNGVIITDPSTTFIDHGVKIGADTRILPCTVISVGCTIGKHCEVGPFAHLRAGTVLEDGAEIGNFVEAKKTLVGAGSKAKHLTYLGDTVIGKNANIGAGTITANYDGVNKHETRIGDRVFIGSGTVIVAPSQLGADSMTGAGAVVKPNTLIGEREVWVGVPARLKKTRDLRSIKEHS
ncbi:MAG: bifunctional N-acetylglucosamine-1-phosphate uridyltransferase/glucosamine-1-phosphate acetyltransferase [Planctomycetes bacterium]|nr:bifunctional N-acetylglucosamine-1-phosphate uridyltransferase/glucosamine-1-phosphate acetyltransferase [Planctomycetota bacterium]